jgi:hypothetical protein
MSLSEHALVDSDTPTELHDAKKTLQTEELNWLRPQLDFVQPNQNQISHFFNSIKYPTYKTEILGSSLGRTAVKTFYFLILAKYNTLTIEYSLIIVHAYQVI